MSLPSSSRFLQLYIAESHGIDFTEEGTLLLQMSRGRIQELAFVNLLIADAFIKEMVPDEAAAAEGLPDENPLFFCRINTELHALGDDDGGWLLVLLSLFFHQSPLPACGCIPSESQAALHLLLSGSSFLTRNIPSRAYSLFQGNSSSRASMKQPCMRL